MKYYLIAGEKSGDMHGANLIARLRIHDVEARFRGFGGDRMEREGMRLATHHREMDFAGLVGLLGHLHTIYIKLKLCKADLLRYRPHVVILIDYGGFNMRIARFCKARGITTFYYIPPKVWAWGQARVRRLKAHVDRIFCILPFEKDFYCSFGIDVEYVGNPVLDAVARFRANPHFLSKYNFTTNQPIVALLPGSRKSELRHILPLFAKLASLRPHYRFAVAALSSMPADLYAPVARLPNVQLVADATYDLLAHAHAAVVASGTATLETALFGAPQVTLYKASALEYFVASRFVNVEHISLVNLIAGKSVIKEYLQNDANKENLSRELDALTRDEAYRNRMKKHYRSIRQLLDVGSASDNAAIRMVAYLRSTD